MRKLIQELFRRMILETINDKDVINQRLVYVSLSDYVEFYLLARCDEYIASPSTFN
jgi:hypothetical protein